MATVLIIDDDAAVRDGLRETVADQQHQVLEATTGVDGLEIIKTRRVDAVLLDLRMPGLDGPALYEALRAMPQTRIPRVIFMTGNAGSGKYATFLRGTTEPMLEKPFNLDTVRHVVNVLLREQ